MIKTSATVFANNNRKKIAIISVRKKGLRLALKIKAALPQSKIYTPQYKNTLKDLTGILFSEYDGIIFCMALGIVTRIIAPFIKDKHSDPAVVCVDDQGRFAISVLSGHEGGANHLAILVSNIIASQPVITTATDAAKNIVIGIGCKRGITKEEVIKALEVALVKAKVSLRKLRCAATIDLKRSEAGLKDGCLELGVPLQFIAKDLIRNFQGHYQRSSFVKNKIGVEGVSEPCALIAARNPRLIMAKRKVGMVTVAVVREQLKILG